MPRYVILEHDHPHLHWDFMLEGGPKLRTWRLEEVPALGKSIEATSLGDHRPLYLDYEGPVSNGRGNVTRWDAGTFTWRIDNEEEVVVNLEGTRLRGDARLSRLHDDRWAFAWDCR